MLKKQFLLCLIVAFGFLHTGQALSATASSGAVTVGDTLTLDVLLTDAIPGDVSASDLDILYDTTLFGAPDVTFGTSLGGPLDSIPSDLPAPGGVNILEVSFIFDPFDLLLLQSPSIHPVDGPLPAGTIFLASLSFLAMEAGAGSFSLGFISIADFFGGPVPAVPGAPVIVGVSPIPLPGALWLMITGLMGIGAMARKRVSAN